MNTSESSSFSPDMTHNESRHVIEQDKKHVWHHLSDHRVFDHTDPLMIVEGKGMHVKDANGKVYLDAVSGAVWTVNVGYGRTSIADAIRDQLVKLPYFAQASGNIPAAQCAEKLISKMPGMSRVYFANSGSEANEKGFKMVRQIAALKSDGRKHKILYRERDYHGTTITALSASGQQERKAQYGPYTPGFVEIPHCLAYRAANGDVADYAEQAVDEIEQIILREDPDTIGAICLEPITAGGGVIVPPPGYMEGVQRLCRQYDILLHIDEVVCGLGRTGKWFGYQHFDIQPDIVTMAKGLASGYAAIACTVTTEAVYEQFKASEDRTLGYFRDISTFGGCTAGPVAALENIKIIEAEGLVENVAEHGGYLMTQLQALQAKHPMIGEVRGKGFFVGIELVTDRETKTPISETLVSKIAAHCLANGVIIGKSNRSNPGSNNCLLLSPALIAGKIELDTIVGAIDEALTACDGYNQSCPSRSTS